MFAPRGNIPETGAMFHIVYTHPDTGQLSTYLTRLYGPVKVCIHYAYTVPFHFNTSILHRFGYNRVMSWLPNFIPCN